MKLAIIQAQTGVLSDNNQNKPNFNTVIPSQKEMGRVGFEPTTSASFLSHVYLSKRIAAMAEKLLFKSHPLHFGLA
jgi:hypothetical protein